MKTLKRISLKNVSEILSDKEMRNVMGGSDGTGNMTSWFGNGTTSGGPSLYDDGGW